MTDIAALDPVVVWKHFATLCAIPRPSKQETGLRNHLADWAKGQGLATDVDEAGNLLIRKPASADKQDRPGVVLQAHLDMVCQANAGTVHDFTKDPIRPVLQADGWLAAPHTTLGADNGIGVALALAALEDRTLSHPALEVLLTVDEEDGMGGAHGLRSGWLKSQIMLNLDTEEWGEFYLGCAGGCDVVAERACATEPAPFDYALHRLSLSGLRGGHSGCDIHLGRGNANKLLARLLVDLTAKTDLRLAALWGGTARNALAREAWADIAIPTADLALVEQTVAAYEILLRQELAGAESKIACTLMPGQGDRVLAKADQHRILAALHAAPHGVRRMSSELPGVVETSNNLGVMRLQDGHFSANLMVRSLRQSGFEALAAEIVSLFTLAECRAEVDAAYPGWTPNPSSPLLALCQDVYARLYGAPAKTQVIHAGLECGIIGAKYPDLDTISFGPTIRGAHAPGEHVLVPTVHQTWDLLRAILAAL